MWALVAVFALLAIVAIVTVAWFFSAVHAPVATMNRYLGDVQHGRNDAAYNLLCRREQQTTAREDFPAAIAPFERNLRSYFAYSFDPIGRSRTVQYRVTDANGHHTTYRATIVREGGAWRVCDFFR